MHPRLKTILVLAILLVTSCAHLSVVHLNKKPWTLGQQDSLAMRYWEFSYTSRLEDNKLVVTGTAWPVAKDLRLYLPTRLDRENGVPFEFHLAPQSLGSSGPLYVSFGYRMELTAEKNTMGAMGTSEVFFASQGALFQ
jgi:hypothetical protein